MSHLYSPRNYVPIENRNPGTCPSCVFYVNGDEFYRGSKLCISKSYKTFDAVKDELTRRVCKSGKRVGYVRNIFTPNGGTRLKNLDELEDGKDYVAGLSRNDKFKPLSYKDIIGPLKPKRNYKGTIPWIEPVVHPRDANLRRQAGKSMLLGSQQQGLQLLVHVNGKWENPVHHLTINYRRRTRLECIANDIQDALGLNVIKTIYQVVNYGITRENFILVTDVDTLQQKSHILVVEVGKDLAVHKYPFEGMRDFKVATSPRVGIPNNNEALSLPNSRKQYRHQYALNNKRPLPSINSSKQSDAVSPFSNTPGSHGTRRGRKSKGRGEVDYDKDEGGVFKAKKQDNARGAHQVNDSRETRTEKPIDQMEAEIVKEEEIHSKEKTTPIPPGTELNKRPSKETKQNADNASQTKGKNEVKKGGKSGKDINMKLNVLPPIVDDGGKDTNDTVKGEKEEIKKGTVKETVEKFEENSGAGFGDAFNMEKEGTPKDLKTDDVIEMLEREVTPEDLKSNDVEVNKPPLSTTPPQGKLSQASNKVQERVDEDAGMHRIDEFADESFNHYDQNTSGAMTKDPRSSTPASRAEERQKREQREYEAAAKIQAGARAYKARKEYNHRKEAKRQEMENESQGLEEARRREEDALRQEEEERRQDEARWQAEQERSEQDREREMEDARRQAEQEQDKELAAQKKQMAEDDAATKIQASFKGHKARKEYQAKKQQVRADEAKKSKSEKEIQAATKIQSSYRGYKVRKEYNNKKRQVKETDINDNEKKEGVGNKKMNEDEAAVAIQAGFKGYKTRKEFAQKKSQKMAESDESKVENTTDNDKQQHEAATKIQANFRGYKARKQYSKKKERANAEQKSATRIQASFRGFRARKEMSEKKKEPQLPDQAPAPKDVDTEELTRAATKIQSGFRGYRARKEYKAKVIDEHIEETDVAQLPDSAVSRSSVKKGQFIQGLKSDVASKIQSAFRVYHAKKVIEMGGDISGGEDIRVTKEADEKIVAAFRGFKTRQIEKEILEKKNSAALKIQANYKGHKVRKTKLYPVRAVNLFHAAVRGYITRKLNNVTVAANNRIISVVNGGHYASIIQALCKGFLTRHTVRKMKEKSKSKPPSAKSLQGPTEGTITQEPDNEVSYWKDTNIKMYSDKTLRKAAAKIQSAIYAHKTRKLFHNRRTKKLKHINPSKSDKSLHRGNAVSKVQSCFKGYLERTGVKKDAREEKVVRESAQKEKEEFNEIANGFQGEVDLSTKSKDLVQNAESEQTGSVTGQTEIPRNLETKTVMPDVDESEPRLSPAREHLPHPPNSRPVSARPTSAARFEQGSARSSSGRKRPRSGRPPSGKPTSGQTRSSSKPGSNAAQRGSPGTEKNKDSENSIEDESNKQIETEFPSILKEETLRSSTRLSGTGSGVMSETVLSLSDIDKEQRRGSARSFSTWKSSEKIRSSGGEVEREGESLREVEDDAGELSSIEKNVNAVCQLQAAFRAYKIRREISELMSGGGELMDIRKIDRAVSALRKDFRLRSAKVRRLGYDQSWNEKRASSCQNWWENVDDYTNDTVNEQDQENQHGQATEHDLIENTSNGDDSLNMTHSRDQDLYGTHLEIVRSDSAAKINSAKEKIEAAYRGYRTRLTEARLDSRASIRKRGGSRRSSVRSAGSRNSSGSVRTVFHVQMHSDVINERCTRLQAAFAGYQTRKVFISLSKLVEQNGQSNSDMSAHKLERMGSLSETDDFKLRHKTIAKIQAAYESHRIAHEAKRGSRLYSKELSFQSSLNKHMVLPPIQQSVQHVQGHTSRPKSGVLRNCMTINQVSDGKAKTQPDLFRRNGLSSDATGLNKIEIYIKKRTAATIIQSHAKAYLTRLKRKLKKTKHKTRGSIGRKTPVSVSSKSSKVCRESRETKDVQNRNREDMTMTEIVRVRTASIKIEAERRKVIAEKIRLKQQAEAKENARTKSENTSNSENDGVKRSDSPECLTPILSSRRLTDEPQQANDLILREEQAAVKIQKVYRGHRTRQGLMQKTESRKQLDNEYEDWKTKRRDAAVSIQSAWRGYSVRKVKSNKKTYNEYKDDRIKDDFSHLEDAGLLVINIGRSKSEIERANRLYDNASMIQMVFRACKIRRQMAIKAAKNRREKNKAASKIQALYKGFVTRHELRQSVSATRIQSVVKAFLARDNMEERKRVEEEERQKAATLLQAAYLSFRKRRENEAMKTERQLNKAAENIQTIGKGFMVRLEHNIKREHRQMLAASRIKVSLLGHGERVRMRERRMAINVILACLRSNQDRQRFIALKEKLEIEKHAATRLQAVYRAYLVRKSNRQYKEKMARQNKAAARIQCALRGRKARREYRIQKEITEKRRESAALKIQSGYRGYKGREIAKKKKKIFEMHNISEEMVNLILNRTFDYVRRRTNSSERIQSTVKGYQTRRHMTLKLTDEAKQRMADASVVQAAYRATFDRKRMANATVIQAAYRAVTDRKQTEKISQKDISATIIQAVFRAKHVRKKHDNKKLLELMNESATKIQSLYRGYMCRKEIKREWEMIASLEPPPSALISARTRSGKLLLISMDEVLMKNARAIILFHRKATELQAAFRAHSTRQEMKDRLVRKTTVTKRTPRRVLSVTKKLSKEDKAAILIQKIFRGYWNRKVYQNAICQRRKLRDHAATKLQAAIKGYRARVEERGKSMRLNEEGKCEVWRQKQDAANIISFAFRSFKHRKEKRALRVEM